MNIGETFRICVLLILAVYFIYRNRGIFVNKKKNTPFYSIYEGNQHTLIMEPPINNAWFEEVNTKYKWDSFEVWDNLYYEYMYQLFDSLTKLPSNKGRSEREIFIDCTHGQKLFWTVLAFGGDIDGGGILSFFWNRPEFAFAIVEVFDELKMDKLKEDYLKCLDDITGIENSISNKDKIRNGLFDRGDGTKYAYSKFARNYKNTDAFDYYYDLNFKMNFYKTIVDYIDSNKSQFIKA